jgi:hypothetical protein
MPPQPQDLAPNWAPFADEVGFEVADLMYRRAQLSALIIDTILDLWTQSMSEFGASSPFKNHDELHATIDSSTVGDVPWECLVTRLSDDDDDMDASAPSWTKVTYDVWYRNPDTVISTMLGNPDFEGQFDLRAYIDLDAKGTCKWNNVMSGNIAWRNSVSIIITFHDIFLFTSPRIQSSCLAPTRRGPCIAHSSLGVTRRLYLWRLDMSSITRCTYQLVTLIILFAARIGTPSYP